jgi:hypothetical protein
MKKAIEDYIDLVGAFDGLLKSQAEMDARSIAGAAGRAFDEAQIKRLIDAQHSGYRHTFLVYGMSNPTFLENLARISKEAVSRVTHRAEELS